MSQRATRNAVAGLSLIEIMIALAIGSLLILGLVQVFAASRTSYQLSEGMSRAQENARFAMDYLQRDIRMAGHYGCVNDQSHLQTVGALTNHFPAAAPGSWGIDFPVSVRGYEASATAPGSTVALTAPVADWDPLLPAAISALAPLPGSDIIELRFLANEGVPVSSITNPTATTTRIQILDPATRWDTFTDNGVAAPDMFGIADCSFADVFFATAVNPGAGTVDVGTFIDRYTPQPAGQTMLYRAESLVYYIAEGASGQPALHRARSAGNGVYTGVEELVEGIENMQLLFGLDSVDDLTTTPPSGYVDEQVPASGVTNTPLQWRRVGLVQVGMLASSPNPAAAGAPASDAQWRRALGVEFEPPAVNDGFYRASYEATIAPRNRLYGN